MVAADGVSDKRPFVHVPQQVQNAMPATFDDLGVHFDYPENWTIEAESVGRSHPSVTVMSPVGGFWSLIIHPASGNLVTLLRTVLDALREEYTDLDAEQATQQIDACQLVGYDVNFYCLDLTNTAQIRGFQTDHGTYVLLWQAEDHDFVRLEPVFRAMATSLVRALL